MGKGPDTTKTTQTTTKNITTTTTNVGDIGITGANAVALVDVLTDANIDSQIVQSQAIKDAGQSVMHLSSGVSQGISQAYDSLENVAGLLAGRPSQPSEETKAKIDRGLLLVGGLAAAATIIAIVKD